MNILLLGGTGTLSGAVRDLSLKKGYSVTIFNRGNNNDHIPGSIKVLVGDFRNKETLENCFESTVFDVVVDFLSRTSSDIERVFPVFQDKCKQYIFISSACVYHRKNGGNPIVEDDAKPNHEWNYSEEKFDCETRLKQLSHSCTSSYTIVRPYITYDDERIPLGIAPYPYRLHRTILERIKSGKPWFVWDGGKSITTVTHVSDFAGGLVGLYLNSKALNEDFHITGDDFCTQRELVEAIFKKLNLTPNIVDVKTVDLSQELLEFAGMLIGDRAIDARFDNTKIKTAVEGLSFDTSIAAGIERVLNYWENQSTYCYDYKFEGRIDRFLSRYTKVGYVKYPHANSASIVIYLLYRYLPLRWANKISRYVK